MSKPNSTQERFSGDNLKPYVPADMVMRDFNLKTVILGIILGALFGSANAYLGLKVGLTISTAIPLAVISVAILKNLSIRSQYRDKNLLELHFHNNSEIDF